MRSILALVACAALVTACEKDEDGGTTDVGDVADTTSDTTADTATDTADDTSDSGGDTATDTPTDTVADTADDTAADTTDATDAADTADAADSTDTEDGSGDTTDATDTTPTGPFNLTFTAAIAPHADQSFWIAVVDTTDDAVLTRESTTVAGDGSVTFIWEALLVEGHDHELRFFADHNGNGACDATPSDHAWVIDLGAATDHVTEHFAHDTSFTEVCATFPDVDGLYDFAFTAAVAPHTGQTFGVAVVDPTGPTTVASDSTTVAGDGSVSMSWENVLVHGTAYEVHFYADHDSSGSCDAPPTDHAWLRDLGAVTSDRSLHFDHDVTFTDVCATF